MDEYNNYQNGYNQNPPPPRRPKKRMNARWLWIIPVLILAAILVMDSFYTLKEDQYAVLTTFGKPTTVSASGLQPKIPLIQKVHKVSKSIQSFPLGYRVGSNESIEEESLMITYDYNFVNVDFYVEYRITDPIKYLYNSSDPVGILKMLCRAISATRSASTTSTASSPPARAKSVRDQAEGHGPSGDRRSWIAGDEHHNSGRGAAHSRGAAGVHRRRDGQAGRRHRREQRKKIRQRGHPRSGGRRRRDRQAGGSLSGEQDQRSHRPGPRASRSCSTSIRNIRSSPSSACSTRPWRTSCPT